MKKGKRAGESEGRSLTPGERAVNWAKAAAVIVPLFGAGYVTNTETVRGFLPDFTGEVSAPVSTDIHPEVRQKLERLIEVINQQKEEIAELKARDKQNLDAVIKRIVVLEQWH